MLVVVEMEATSTFQAAMPGELRAVLFICFVLNLFFFYCGANTILWLRISMLIILLTVTVAVSAEKM